MNIRRALIAAGIQVLITIIVTTIIVTLYITVLGVRNRGAFSEGEAAAIGGRVGHWAGLMVGIVAAFLAGWWGARGLGERAIAQGLLIGGLIAAVGIVFAAVAGEVSAMTALVVLDIVAATAGAAVARSRERTAVPSPS